MLIEFEVVILAAGESKRFGSGKQLANLKGQPLLQHAIQSVLDLGIKPWLVLGAYRDQILANQHIETGRCHIVTAQNWQQGMSCSINAALNQLNHSRPLLSGVLFLLGDQPAITAPDLMKLISVINRDRSQIVCSEYHDGVGVPAYFPRRCFDELNLLEGDRGAKSIIKAHAHVPVSLGKSLIDIDHPEDLDRH